MFKYIAVLSLIGLAACAFHVDMQTPNTYDRVLFQQHVAKQYSHGNKYDELLHQPYFETTLGAGKFTYDVQLLASTVDRVSWIPYTGCAKDDGTCWGEKTKPSVYDCGAEECKVGADKGCGTFIFESTHCESHSFHSASLSQNGEVTCQEFYDATDHFTIRHTTVENVALRLCSKFAGKSRKGVVQHGVLGLGYNDKERSAVEQGSQQLNLLTQMVDQKIIKREEFSYYISDTKSFLTFGVRDDYLSRLGFSKYKFTPTYKKTDSKHAANWHLTVATLKSENPDLNLLTDTEHQIASNDVDASAHSIAVIDSSAWGYYFSSKAYFNNFIKVLKKNGKNTCAQFPLETDLNAYDDSESQSTSTGKKFPHIECSDCDSLENFPTLQVSFADEIDQEDVKNNKIWSIKPEHYAEVDSSNHKCIVHFYRKLAQNQGVETAPTATQNEEKTLYFGRMFLKYFYTSFDQENRFIRISEAWHNPEPFKLDSSIIIIVLVVGIIAIIFAFIVQHILLFALPKWRVANNNVKQQPQQVQQVQYVQQQPMFVSQPPVHLGQSVQQIQGQPQVMYGSQIRK